MWSRARRYKEEAQQYAVENKKTVGACGVGLGIVAGVTGAAAVVVGAVGFAVSFGVGAVPATVLLLCGVALAIGGIALAIKSEHFAKTGTFFQSHRNVTKRDLDAAEALYMRVV